MKLSVSKSSAAEIAKTAKAISICLVSCYLKVRYLFITSLHQLRYPDLLREMLPSTYKYSSYQLPMFLLSELLLEPILYSLHQLPRLV